MAVSLLALSTGHYSLEFAPLDMPAVKAAILQGFGEPEIQWHAFSAAFRFGGCTFTFQDEWEAPCLISSTSEGDSILKDICRSINAGA